MPQSPIAAAIKQICDEKNIPYEAVIETVEAALAVAYRKDFGEKNQNIKVTFDPETSESRVFDVKEVVENELFEEYERRRAEEQAAREAADAAGEGPPVPEEPVTAPPAEGEGEPEKRFDPKTMIALTQAKKINKKAKVSDVLKQELFPPTTYGRMAAQTAKQVIIQRLREAEREMVFKEYKDREGDLLNGTVQRVENRLVFVDLGSATAIMPPPEQVPTERYTPSMRLKFYLVSVNASSKGPELLVSRSHQEVVRKLFEQEVPELSSHAIEIRAIAREPGSRSKIAVVSHEPNIDPVGSCVGQRGTRVQTVIMELGGEKIDIIEFDEDAARFITNALSPAKIVSVTLNEEAKVASAEVKEDQLSLAIGRAGQNVRLASKLTGWRIDIIREGKEESAPAAETPPAVPEAPAAVPPAEVATPVELSPGRSRGHQGSSAASGIGSADDTITSSSAPAQGARTDAVTKEKPTDE